MEPSGDTIPRQGPCLPSKFSVECQVFNENLTPRRKRIAAGFFIGRHEEVSMFPFKKVRFYGSALAITAVLLLVAGCPNPEQSAFVPVTDIAGAPSTGAAGTPVDLSAAAVVPADATNQAIAWTVKTAGAGVSAISGNSFTPTSAGTVTLTATVADGKAQGEDFAKDFTITISAQEAFVPVSNISGAPTGGTAGSEVDLSTVTVTPDNAANKTVLWTVKDAGTTGVSDADVADGKFTPAAAGALTLLATIANGSSRNIDYTQEFAIIISAPNTFVPVTEISGAPDSGFVGDEVDLTVATVVPDNAGNKSIAWTVKNAGTTSLTIADIVDGKFTPANAGTVTLLATIVNGRSPDTDYTKEFKITIAAPDTFVPVTNITGIPDRGTAGSPVSLSGATVVPGVATYQAISWVVKDDGDTGVTNAMVAAGSSFTPGAAGILILTARILSGEAEGTPYIQDFTINIEPAFVPVNDIEGLPESRNAVAGLPLDLNPDLNVVPPDATNKTIVWTVKEPGLTGLTTASVASGVFTPPSAGTATLSASILNGKAQGENFTKDIAITIIKPVTGIVGVPARGTRGQELSLSGVTAAPSDATNTTIVWSIKSSGTTGVIAIAGNSFTPPNTGVLELTATIANGSAMGTPFVRDYTIRINEPGAVPPEFGLGEDTSILLKDKDGTALSNDSAVQLNRNAVYYVFIDTAYTDVAWYLNGAKQSEQGSMIYLDTSTARTIKLVVEGKKDGVFESSVVYTFTISG
jgi:endo-1,4-beta-xylanase